MTHPFRTPKFFMLAASTVVVAGAVMVPSNAFAAAPAAPHAVVADAHGSTDNRSNLILPDAPRIQIDPGKGDGPIGGGGTPIDPGKGDGPIGGGGTPIDPGKGDGPIGGGDTPIDPGKGDGPIGGGDTPIGENCHKHHKHHTRVCDETPVSGDV